MLYTEREGPQVDGKAKRNALLAAKWHRVPCNALPTYSPSHCIDLFWLPIDKIMCPAGCKLEGVCRDPQLWTDAFTVFVPASALL